MNGRFVCFCTLAVLLATPSLAQHRPGMQGSRNIHVLSHIPMAHGRSNIAFNAILDVEIEQELSRPFVYISQLFEHDGFDVISVKDPENAEIIYSWRIDDPEPRTGLSGAFDGRYFKLKGRYYYAQGFQYMPGGPDVDLGAIVFDVTGLPDPSAVKEVGRILAPDTPAGFHNVFAYKHSSGRVLLFTTTMSPAVNVYDMEKFLAGERVTSLVGKVVNPNPDPVIPMGFHDMYVAYDPATRQDKFYGPGLNSFLVYDVTAPEEPKLLTSISGVAGMDLAHAFQATPDGRYGVTQMEYRHAPIRIFDLKPGLEGEMQTISRPIGAWQAEPNGWNNASHNHQIRWPYVFVASFDDGLQVINMMDPTNPYTVGYYDTQDGPDLQGLGLVVTPDGVEDSNARGNTIFNGAWGINVRNADGLIVISDFMTGFWAFKMDGFDGWNGHQWGMPNISSAQDWDNGPDGAPAPARVS